MPQTIATGTCSSRALLTCPFLLFVQVQINTEIATKTQTSLHQVWFFTVEAHTYQIIKERKVCCSCTLYSAVLSLKHFESLQCLEAIQKLLNSHWSKHHSIEKAHTEHWETNVQGRRQGGEEKLQKPEELKYTGKEGELKHMASHASFQVMGSWKILDHDRGSEIQLEFCSASSLIFPATHANLDCCVLL